MFKTQACKFVGNTTESNIVSVILNPIPIATLSTLGTTTICQNDSVNIIAPPNMSSYLGSNGTTANHINVSNGGNYSVQITDSNGCTSTSPIVTIVNALPADFNKNGKVDVNDFTAFGQIFGTSCATCPQDINQDDTIDISDYQLFLASFGLSCQ